MKKRKIISFKEWDSALFNLDSMRTSLQVKRDNMLKSECYEIDLKINEIEYLIGKMHIGKITHKEWVRIQEIISERKIERYTSCINNGIDESVAAGAFDD